MTHYWSGIRPSSQPHQQAHPRYSDNQELRLGAAHSSPHLKLPKEWVPAFSELLLLERLEWWSDQECEFAICSSHYTGAPCPRKAPRCFFDLHGSQPRWQPNSKHPKSDIWTELSCRLLRSRQKNGASTTPGRERRALSRGKWAEASFSISHNFLDYFVEKTWRRDRY